MDLLASLIRRQSTKASATPEAATGASEEAAAAAADASDPEAKSETTDEAEGAAGEEDQDSNEEGGEKDEDAKYEQEESFPIWQTILFLAVVGVGGWFGSFTIAELLPTATAPQSIRQRAFSLLEGDNEVNERFGKVARSYGAGYGSERGRRNFVQSYSYTQGGEKYTRIKFMVETDEKRRGVVFAEVSHKNPRAWSYVMVGPERPGGGRRLRRRDIIVVEDNRKPVKPLEVRQADVVSRILTSGTRLYHGGPLDQHGQGQMRRLGHALTESMRGALLVDCSREAEEVRCEQVGFAKGQSPIWAFKKNGRTEIKKQRVLELNDLEEELGMND
jgi:hypothetical protein